LGVGEHGRDELLLLIRSALPDRLALRGKAGIADIAGEQVERVHAEKPGDDQDDDDRADPTSAGAPHHERTAAAHAAHSPAPAAKSSAEASAPLVANVVALSPSLPPHDNRLPNARRS